MKEADISDSVTAESKLGMVERLNVTSSEPDSITSAQIAEKFARRMRELHIEDTDDLAAFAEMNPDVIVISADRSLLFEPQNRWASEMVRRRCGLNLDPARVQERERVRVHPCESQKIIDDLTRAGLKIV